MGSSWKHGFYYEVEAEEEAEAERLRGLAGEGTVESSQHMRAEMQHMREDKTIRRDKKALLADIDKHIKNLETLQGEESLNPSQEKRISDKLSVLKAAREDVESNGQSNRLAEAIANPNNDYKKGIFSKTERLVNRVVSLYQRAKQSPVNLSWDKVASTIEQNRKDIKGLPELRAKIEESKSALMSATKEVSRREKRLAEIQQRQMQLLRTTIKHTPKMKELRTEITSLKERNAEIKARNLKIMQSLGDLQDPQRKTSQKLEKERAKLTRELLLNEDLLSSKRQLYDNERRKAVAPEQESLKKEAEKLLNELSFYRGQKQSIVQEIDKYSKSEAVLQQVEADPLFIESQELMLLKSRIDELEATVLELEERVANPTDSTSPGEQKESQTTDEEQLSIARGQLMAAKTKLDNDIKPFLSKHPDFGAKQHTLEKELLKHLVVVSGKKNVKSIDKTAVLHAALDFVRMPTKENYEKLEAAQKKHPQFNAAMFHSATESLVNETLLFKDLAKRVEDDVKDDFLSGSKPP